MSARAEEIVEVKKHGVYAKVPTDECWDNTGKAPFDTRWIDVNKGASINPLLRSRLVAKDTHKRDDIFAAMPPPEAR